jgi:dTDP-glucose pyrophosphorylase
MTNKLNILIPAAGTGSRFKIDGYTDIKPMIKIGDKTMIELAINSLQLSGQFIFVVNKGNGQLEELVSEIKRVVPDAIIIEIDYLTEGPASTALLASEYIDNDTPLVIANCDQIMEWGENEFSDAIFNTDKDGLVVTYNVVTEKNSYVKIDENGNAVMFAEKQIISEHSLNGIHFWKKGSDFVLSTKQMIEKNIRYNNEFYVSQTYNELIELGKKIGIYEIPTNKHWAVGTPSDLKLYLDHANL